MSYVNSFPNPVVRGVINPLKQIIQKKELHFDSRFRDNYGAPGTSSSSFLYKLPSELDDVVSLRLASIHIPDAVLLISSSAGNNKLTVNNEELIIPDGTYSLADLRTQINDLITGQLAIDVKFEADGTESRKTKIVNNSGAEVSVVFYSPNNCTNFMNTVGWILGFRVSSVTLSGLLGSNAVSAGLFDDNATNYLYLSVEDFQRNVSNNNIVYLNKTTTNNSILGKIYRSALDGTYTLNQMNDGYILSDKVRKYYGPVRLSKFKFSLLDKFGNIVDLNNMDYSFTLEAEILYDRDNVTIPC